MAGYETIPKETEPLVAAAPRSASPKFKAAALAICLFSAVAGYQAPAAIKYLSFSTEGNGNLPNNVVYSRDVQICLALCGKKTRPSWLRRAASKTTTITVSDCVEINQCVGCTRQFFTKSFLGDDAADLARSSGEEPVASPRKRRAVTF